VQPDDMSAVAANSDSETIVIFMVFSSAYR